MLFAEAETHFLMQKPRIITGFSRMAPEEKLRQVTSRFKDPAAALKTITSFLHPDQSIQKILSEFSENTLTNFAMPYGLAPNFLINGEVFMVPMVIEESSVVAAASAAARFWADRGGFSARVRGKEKNGQLHFRFTGDAGRLEKAMPAVEAYLREKTLPMAANMARRGGGITSMMLKNRPEIEPNYFQLFVNFETADAMGANFVNSVLEEFGVGLKDFFYETPGFAPSEYEPLMAILSNHTPGCLVEVSVECPVGELGLVGGLEPEEFVRRFELAVRVAQGDVHRATTHNKGIMNGVDAVVLATGNDFRAIEAGAHAYAAQDGQYRSLSHSSSENGIFRFWLEMPMSLGTTGGLTKLHPLAALSLELLGHPGAERLMMIAGSAGLANNFAALRSLVTTGIQAGHMRMHLPNVLMQLNASDEEMKMAGAYFADKKPSHQAVAGFLKKIRDGS